jgi:hypothetical protein
MEAVIILHFVLVAISFYYVGKYRERIKWNKLIKEGKLPKPNK